MPWDPELLCAQANAELQRSADADPDQHPWGLYSWGDAPPACGGGSGLFQWFASLEALLAWVTDLSAATYGSAQDEQPWLDLRHALRTIAAGYPQAPADALEQLNARLRGELQIDWIGQWHELLGAPGGFPESMRGRFRREPGAQSAGRDGEPILAAELDAFKAYVRGYGG